MEASASIWYDNPVTRTYRRARQYISDYPNITLAVGVAGAIAFYAYVRRGNKEDEADAAEGEAASDDATSRSGRIQSATLLHRNTGVAAQMEVLFREEQEGL